MRTDKYTITIAKKDENITSNIKFSDSKDDTFGFIFDTVLCDLISSNKILKIENNTFDIEYYEYEKSFGKDLYVYEDKQYWEFREELLSIIQDKKEISSNELDKLKQFYNVEFDFKILNKDTEVFNFKKNYGEIEKNLSGKQLADLKQKYKILKDETLNSIKELEKLNTLTKEQKKELVELKNLYESFNNLSTDKDVKSNYERIVEQIEKAIQEQITFNADFIFVYTCYSVVGIMYCILHYLTTNNYRFLKCKHCEKYFATKGRNAGYCKRNSKLKGYEDKDCHKAKKAYLNALAERYTHKYKYVLGFVSEKESNEFVNEYKIQRELAGKKPTVENIEKLKHILSDEYIQKTYLKYKDPTVSDIIVAMNGKRARRY